MLAAGIAVCWSSAAVRPRRRRSGARLKLNWFASVGRGVALSTIRYNAHVSASAPGILIRDARHRAGLTQAELGRRAGVTQSVVSAYESGARQPSLPTLERLVRATGCEIDLSLRKIGRRAADGPIGHRLSRDRQKVRDIVARYGLSNVRVFGSVARGEDTPDSDVDLLVDVPPGVGLLTLARCERDLEVLLGVRVDLVPTGDLKPAVAATAVSEARPV